LEQLMAGMSLCDALICSDGGAMHLAAGLDKPILAFFWKFVRRALASLGCVISVIAKGIS
jgi:hypothetical protein